MIDREEAKLCIRPGWRGLVDKVYDALPDDVTVVQIKQKWGGLRVNVNSAPREFYQLLSQVEVESYTVCESCGEEGELLMVGGWRVRCEECEDQS